MAVIRSQRVPPDGFRKRWNTARPSAAGRRGAFTLVELLVVIAIIVVAAGVMTPALMEYAKTRMLKGVQRSFTSTLSRARMKAVTEGRSISVVFFKEGLRIYDELHKIFADESWSPQDSPLGSPRGDLWYVLGCAGGLTSNDRGFRRTGYKPKVPFIPPLDWFQKRQAAVREKLKGQGVRVKKDRVKISGLAKVTYKRDGTLIYGVGMSDVSSASFRIEPPSQADIKIYQRGNRSVGFIDLRSTGQLRSKTSAVPEATMAPGMAPGEQGSKS